MHLSSCSSIAKPEPEAAQLQCHSIWRTCSVCPTGATRLLTPTERNGIPRTFHPKGNPNVPRAQTCDSDTVDHRATGHGASSQPKLPIVLKCRQVCSLYSACSRKTDPCAKIAHLKNSSCIHVHRNPRETFKFSNCSNIHVPQFQVVKLDSIHSITRVQPSFSNCEIDSQTTCNGRFRFDSVHMYFHSVNLKYTQLTFPIDLHDSSRGFRSGEPSGTKLQPQNFFT